MQPQFGPAQQKTAGPGTSRQDLQILAQGCHGTWLPRVTDSDRTQSCRDCRCRGGVSARGGELRRARHVDREARCGHDGAPFSRAESKPDPHRHSLQESSVLGHRTRGSRRFVGQPRVRVCIPFRNGSAGRFHCAAGSWNVGSFGEFFIEPTWEAICLPKPHPSGGVALSLIATHRPQSLFVAVTKHEAVCRVLALRGCRLITPPRLPCHPSEAKFSPQVH
jgi:hypothetical protein